MRDAEDAELLAKIEAEVAREWTMLLNPTRDRSQVEVTLVTEVDTLSYEEAQNVAEAGRYALIALKAIIKLCDDNLDYRMRGRPETYDQWHEARSSLADLILSAIHAQFP